MKNKEEGKACWRSCCLLGLRIVAVIIFLYHGIPKAFNPSMAMGKFVNMGFPGFLGPVIGWLEVIGAALLILGIWYKYANYVLAAIIVVALIGVHIPATFSSGKLSAGIERDFLLLFTLLLMAAKGPGKYRLNFAGK